MTGEDSARASALPANGGVRTFKDFLEDYRLAWDVEVPCIRGEEGMLVSADGWRREPRLLRRSEYGGKCTIALFTCWGYRATTRPTECCADTTTRERGGGHRGRRPQRMRPAATAQRRSEARAAHRRLAGDASSAEGGRVREQAEEELLRLPSEATCERPQAPHYVEAPLVETTQAPC